MRYIMIMMLRPDAETEAPAIPDSQAMATMGRYNEELVQAGVLLSLDGLRPTAEGGRLYFQKGSAPAVWKDGPFTETKEIVGGFWLIQVKSHEEAVSWARRVPKTSDKIEAYVELRRVFEMEDFSLDAQSELAEQAQKISQGLAKDPS